MRRYVRGIAAVVAAGIALVTAPIASASTPYFGFSDNSVHQRQVSAATNAQLAKGAGATTTRTMFNWREVEQSPGDLELSYYDNVYAANLALGIRPIFTLMNAPRWALPVGVICGADEDCRHPPSSLHDGAWRAIVATIATRYPQLAALEVWNEPNMSMFWGRSPNPARYADLVKQAYDASHAVNPGLPVIAGSMANITTDDDSTMPYRKFLFGMYQAGVKGKMDGLAIHPYPNDIDPWLSYRMLEDVRDARDNAGDSTTELWLTELGVSTTDTTNPNFTFDENSQGALLVHMLASLRTMPDVAAVVYHTLIDDTTQPEGSRGRGFGVVGAEPELVPKPGYCALANANQTGYTCPEGVDSQQQMSATQELRWTAQNLLQTAADAARAYRAANGSYTGLTRAALHALAPEISEAAPDQQAAPGPVADPSRIGISIWKATNGAQWLIVCNNSNAGLSYCIKTSAGVAWSYGSTSGSINATADALRNNRTYGW